MRSFQSVIQTMMMYYGGGDMVRGWYKHSCSSSQSSLVNASTLPEVGLTIKPRERVALAAMGGWPANQIWPPTLSI